MINAIISVSLNNVVSKDNEIPWDNEEYLNILKTTTEGSVVIMGYNTWVSIGEIPIAGRTNIILTRNPKKVKTSANVKVFKSPPAIVLYTKKSKDVWIIGGASTISSFIKYINNVVVARIPVVVDGGDLVYLPNIFNDLKLVAKTQANTLVIENYVKSK